MKSMSLGGRVLVVRRAVKRNRAAPHFYERYFGHTKLSNINFGLYSSDRRDLKNNYTIKGTFSWFPPSKSKRTS